MTATDENKGLLPSLTFASLPRRGGVTIKKLPPVQSATAPLIHRQGHTRIVAEIA
jgi:hypothetical protein